MKKMKYLGATFHCPINEASIVHIIKIQIANLSQALIYQTKSFQNSHESEQVDML
jgi:hypothetical protein